MKLNDHNSESISWFVEKIMFKTVREAHEWVYSSAYNEIGYLYDGYKTIDPKLAYALLYELVRSNTIHERRHEVYCDEELIEGTLVYKVWVKKLV
ncbi:hypothetical protein [Cohnella sp. JJ-181]|uniref:hypothetical protein n=1 Tax=Cohnella rhizoplanae TaxID=2974897 RepID=UPI0022FF7FF5|nr:hypothetical protein [Cohnella sp. JJ-181]CAI6087327.1 hypothetical protein COHCIP112018_05452 [Cohnella sp. JJ-181]